MANSPLPQTSLAVLPPSSPRRPIPLAGAGLNWPAPHHMRIIDPGAGRRPENGLVTLADGERLQGTVQQIDFEARQLEFNTEARGRLLLPFESVRTLFLARSIELELIPLAVPPGRAQGRPSLRRHSYEVRFRDDTFLRADVVAVLPRKEGLFLFVANYADSVLRWFIPAEAIASHRDSEGLAKAGDSDAGAFDGPREELERALGNPKPQIRRSIGDILVRDGIITEQQRDAALVLQAQDRGKLIGEILVETGQVNPDAVRKALVEQLGVPFVSLTRFPFDPNAIRTISADLARKYLAMPLYRTESRIAIALENPLSWQALNELEFFTGLKVDPALAQREELLDAIRHFYADATSPEMIDHLVAELGKERPAQPVQEIVSESDNTLVRLVNKMIVDAFDQGASDIHIESRPGDKPSRVRFRVDGVLAPYIDVPPNFRAALVSRLKIMAELDISEHRRPQDGKIAFENYGPRSMELRVVTMPTAHGLEDVVMRILAAPRALSIDQLGLSPRDLLEIKGIANRSFGLLFVCGPTGSGKTTTLHSLLAHINTAERKIWTVEDPVEISQDGLCQVQVNPKLGLTFPNVLRSFLRADPDVIMVGETRDPETASTVIGASLTGHLVFSTMHTNSAVESVVRLLDFGLDPFNFSDALLGVMGQRLVRRLCPDCRKPYVAGADEVNALAHEYCRESGQDPAEIAIRWRSRYGASDGSLTLHSATGCAKCDDSGYKGRMGVYELLLATPAVKARIRARAASPDILQEAIAGGMVTLEQDGIEKVLRGELDFKQVQLSCR